MMKKLLSSLAAFTIVASLAIAQTTAFENLGASFKNVYFGKLSDNALGHGKGNGAPHVGISISASKLVAAV